MWLAEVSNPQQFQFGAQVPTGAQMLLGTARIFCALLTQAASVLDPERYIFPKFKDRRTDVSRTRAENLTLWCGHTREPSSWDLTARQHTQCVQFVQRSGASLQIEL